MASSNNTSLSESYFPTNNSTSTAPVWALTLIGILTFTTVISNLVVIILFIVSSRLRTPFNYYLLNIAINDFLTGAVAMPYYAFFTYYGYWPLSDTHCTIWMFFDFSVPFVSLWGVVAISLDRLWAVIRPISYRRNNNRKKAFVLIAAGWFINYSALLPGYIYTRTHFTNQSVIRTCLWDQEGIPAWATNFPVVVVDIFTPMVLTVVFYILIGLEIRKSNLRMASVVGPVNDARKPRSRKRLRDRQAFMVLTSLVVAFVAAWLPWVVCEALQLITEESYPVFSAVTYWTSYALSGLNPFMFGIASRDMRQAFRHLTRGKNQAASNRGSRIAPSSSRF